MNILTVRSVVLSLLLSILGQASALETADCHELTAMVTTSVPNTNATDEYQHQHHHMMTSPESEQSVKKSDNKMSNCCDSINCSCSSACSTHTFVGQEPFVLNISTQSFAISSVTQMPPTTPVSDRYRPPIAT